MLSLEILFKKDKKAELVLKDGQKTLDVLIIPIDFHFDNMLVTSVDKILKRNRIEILSLKTIKVGGRKDKSSMAYMIAQCVASALKAR